MSKRAAMVKRLKTALEEFKGSNFDLLYIVSEHLDLEEPNAGPILWALANMLCNEERKFDERKSS